MQHVEPDDTSDTRPKRRRISLVIRGVVLVVLLVLVPVIFALPWLDSLDRQWVQCHVVDASPSKGSWNSPSTWRVAVETQDCGEILYSNGVTTENVEDIADQFAAGAYDFQLGWISKLSTQGYIPGMHPSAAEYRPAT